MTLAGILPLVAYAGITCGIRLWEYLRSRWSKWVARRAQSRATPVYEM